MASAERQGQAAPPSRRTRRRCGGAGGERASAGRRRTRSSQQMQQRMSERVRGARARPAGLYVRPTASLRSSTRCRGMTGRKSVVLFSEGVAIPPAVQRLFLGVVDAANRANVSIYTMDAAGLRAESEQAKIRDQVNAAGAAGSEGARTPSAGRTRPMMKDAREERGRAAAGSAHGPRRAGAEAPAGQLFENTNNLRQGFERIESDLRNYYLLGYTPQQRPLRRQVPQHRSAGEASGSTVAARKGYFAVREHGRRTGEYLGSARRSARSSKASGAKCISSPGRGACSFPESRPPGVVPVLVHLKTEPMTFTPSADQKTFTSDFAIVVRFLGPQNKVVRKVGQHYEMSGPDRRSWSARRTAT